MRALISLVQTALLFIACLAAPGAYAQSKDAWQGTWNTIHGQVKLQQTGKYVYGDYGNWGVIQGVVSEREQTMRGVYKRNDDQTSGHFEWKLVGKDRFRGRWVRSGSAFPSWNNGGGDWSGLHLTKAKPRLSVYKGNSNIGTFMGAQDVRYQRWINALYNPSRTAGISDRLNYGRALTSSKLSTAFKMQKHVRAVSKKGDVLRSNGDTDVGIAFADMGYQLLGDGIITETGNRVSALRAVVARDGDSVVVSFRGTKGDTGLETAVAGIFVDANVTPSQPLFIPTNKRRGALVHAGFQSSYMVLRAKILAALKDQKGTHLYITGHSLGGAMATLMAWDIAVNFKRDFATITHIASGAPRVGNAAFKRAFETDVPDNLRIIVNRDPVPAVPWLEGVYRHAGRSLVIGGSDGVLMRHQDHDVRPNIRQFGNHSNELYYQAVRKLAQNAPKNTRLNPNGNAWASAATVGWYDLSREKRGTGAVAQTAKKAKKGAKKVIKRGKEWLDKRRKK